MTTPDQTPDTPEPDVAVTYVDPRLAAAWLLAVAGLVLGVLAAYFAAGRVGALTAGATWCTCAGLLLGATGGDDNHGPT